MKDLILFGPPGAGKGTQGALLASALDMKRLSTGDVLRAAVERGTAMGLEARRFMEAGELVPDPVILGIVRDYLGDDAADTGVIFDGFPRTLPQARGLDETLQALDRPLGGVLVLNVAPDSLVRRLSGRRTCSQCGALFNVYFEPPAQAGRCDRCGGELTMRADDDAATVQRRLDVYAEQTEPLLEYYAGAGAPVHRVDGDRPVETVQEDLLRVVRGS